MLRSWTRSFLLGTSFLFATVAANATTWYVATTGNDANAGTLSAPYATITKGASKAQPGDVVLVKGGVYTGIVNVYNKGTAALRVTIRSDERAVIDGTGTAANTNLVQLHDVAYLDFTGFEVRNATRLGICGYPAQHVSITNNVVHDSYTNGIYVGSSPTVRSNDVLIDGNQVYHTCLSNAAHAGNSGWGQAIGVESTDNARINNNKVYENDGNGIDFVLSSGGSSTGNELYDNFSTSFYLDNATSTVVDGNLIYSTGNSRYYRNALPANGIGMANESYDTSNPLNGITITNNIVLNSNWAIFYGAYDNGGGLQNVTIANNTFYYGAKALLAIEDGPHTNTVVENNVFYQVGGGVMDLISGPGLTFRNNSWYGGNVSTAKSATDVVGDPRLSNAGGLRARDYMLTAGSPAVAKGVNLSTLVKTDYFGTARPALMDVGAHQSVGLQSQPDVDVQAPTAPTALGAVSIASNSIVLAWTASTDNVAVTGYRVKRDGAVVATVTVPTWTDTTASAFVSYTYQVVAFDAAGNQSAGSNAIPIQLAVQPGGVRLDTAAPTSPAGLRVTAQTLGAVSLAWAASSDNVGVTAYRVLRNGVAIGSLTFTAWTDTTVAPGTAYAYQVIALDAAGNESVRSASVTVQSTPAPATTTRHRAAGK
jgi:chitodextrinase